MFYRGAGCKKCHDSGFQGRSGIYEVLEIDDELYKLISHGADEAAIKDCLPSKNFSSLRQAGLGLVEAGHSTLEEVLRVTHMEAQEKVRAETSPSKRVAVAAAAARVN